MSRFSTNLHAPKMLRVFRNTNDSWIKWNLAVPGYMRQFAKQANLNGVTNDLIDIVKDYIQRTMYVYEHEDNFDENNNRKLHIYQGPGSLFVFSRNFDGRVHYDEDCEIHKSTYIVLKPALTTLLNRHFKTTEIVLNIPFHECNSRKYFNGQPKRHPGFRMEFTAAGFKKDSNEFERFLKISAKDKMLGTPTIRKIIRNGKLSKKFGGESLKQDELPDYISAIFKYGVSNDNEVEFINYESKLKFPETKITRNLTFNEMRSNITLKLTMTQEDGIDYLSFNDSGLSSMPIMKNQEWILLINMFNCTCKAYDNIVGTILQVYYQMKDRKYA